MEDKKYLILAYYLFTPIEDPAREVAAHHAFFEQRNVAGRIYISPEGINGQMSGIKADATAYMEWLRADARFQAIDFKVHRHTENVFPRMTVKVRSQLVALDVPVDPKKRGEYIAPALWKEMLEDLDEETLLLDVRNAYEWEIGHFVGSTLPPFEAFRQFPLYAKRLKEERDPRRTKVMMYCTGGIRCELYSALLKEEGFTKVYQLQGGVLRYGQEEGDRHWRGKLFVFDDRLAVPLSEEGAPNKAISHCRYCDVASDIYRNCANMDCNELFVVCPVCAEKFLGCCQSACFEAPRRRPFAQNPKPFRRKGLLECS